MNSRSDLINILLNTIASTDLSIEDEEDDDLNSELKLLAAANGLIAAIPRLYNTDSKYRVPFTTALRYASLAEPITPEILIKFNVNRECKAAELLLNATRFYRLTQLEPQEFLDLLSVIEPIYARLPMKSVSGIKNPQGETTNSSVMDKRKLDLADILLLWIIHLDGVAAEIVAWIFGISESSVRNYCYHLTQVVLIALEGELYWPDAEERKLLHGLFPIYEKAIGVIDGTHCEIRVPTKIDDEIGYYSGYKHKHTQLYLVVVDAHGFFRWIEGPFPGKNADRGVFTQSKLYTEKEKYFSDGEVMLADGGFKGDGPIIHPYDKTSLENAGDERKGYEAYNDLLTDSRSQVEHGIHRLKVRAAILSMRFAKDKQHQFDILKASTLLFNWTRKHRIQKQLKTQQ